LPQISADKRRSEIISRESTRKNANLIWFMLIREIRDAISSKEVPQRLKPTVFAGYTAGLRPSKPKPGLPGAPEGLLHPVVGHSKAGSGLASVILTPDWRVSYLDEQVFRYNNRKDRNENKLSDSDRPVGSFADRREATHA
jgi:hypothetical protein